MTYVQYNSVNNFDQFHQHSGERIFLHILHMKIENAYFAYFAYDLHIFCIFLHISGTCKALFMIAYICICFAYVCIYLHILFCISLHILCIFVHMYAYLKHICAYNGIFYAYYCIFLFTYSCILTHIFVCIFVHINAYVLPSLSMMISGSSRSRQEGRGVVTACAGSCVRRKCWVPEESGSVLLSCVCVRTRNYGATQRFHKLNIHSFMPERPHKRNCPEMTQYTLR
jgi:hypothetical protein